MEIVSLDKKTLARAVSVLKRGGVLVYPTETAYGLGCDATDARVVKRIFQIKGRTFKKPLPLIAGSRTMAGRYVVMSPVLKKLAARYWPGPLTVVATVIPNSPARLRMDEVQAGGQFSISKSVAAGTGTVGIRVSGYGFARILSQKLGRPIVATSANRAGGRECYTLLDVLAQLDPPYLPDLCIDGGRLKKRKPSTVVMEENGKIVVLRKGPIRIR